MASGHVNRANRPNTWLHRPSLRSKVFPCQLGAVHTWHQAGIGRPAGSGGFADGRARNKYGQATLRSLNHEAGACAGARRRAGSCR
jgi:hypothetical protein